tara:strand:+ start:316 stop:513 length:198 start_codon:yes stop_codon:yes gene_type:complete
MTSDIDKWNRWIEHLSVTSGKTSVKLSNIEKTLDKYIVMHRRMLLINTLLILGVIGLNGLLLFYI